VKKHQSLDKFPVSTTDELSITGESRKDRNRALGEFKATNIPLSASDISKRKRESQEDWTPRTTENIEDVKPEPEHSEDASENRAETTEEP
jgi:gas vesicle protein